MSDDFDDDDDLGFEEKDFDSAPKKNSVGQFINDNPMAKIGLVVGAAALIFGAIVIFGKKKVEAPNSVIQTANQDVKGSVGSAEATPAYVQQVQAKNVQQLEEALRKGESAIPTPVEPAKTVIVLDEKEKEAEDPLHRWRKIQEDRVKQEVQQRQQIESETIINTDVQDEAVKNMSQKMLQQMQSVLKKKSGKTSYHFMGITDPAVLDTANSGSGSGTNNGGSTTTASSDQSSTDQQMMERVLVHAGDIAYAQLLIEANTDAPGPLLGMIASGPLKGYKIMGSFSSKDEVLTLNFNQLIKGDEVISIDAIALDPETTLPGLATEVNHRYFQRIIIPVAASFVQGFSQAAAETGNTNVQVQGETVATQTSKPSTDEQISKGLQTAMDEVKSIIDEQGSNIKVMIRITAGTPFGLLFLNPVKEQVPADPAAEQ